MADALRREPVAGVGGRDRRRHARPVAGSPPARNPPRANSTVSDRLTDEAAAAGARAIARLPVAGSGGERNTRADASGYIAAAINYWQLS